MPDCISSSLLPLIHFLLATSFWNFLEALPSPHARSTSGPLHLLPLGLESSLPGYLHGSFPPFRSWLNCYYLFRKALFIPPSTSGHPLACFIFCHHLLLCHIYIFCLLVYCLSWPLGYKFYEGTEVVYFTTILSAQEGAWSW